MIANMVHLRIANDALEELKVDDVVLDALTRCVLSAGLRLWELEEKGRCGHDSEVS